MQKYCVNFSKFDLRYTQTCTPLESSTMGHPKRDHCSVFSPPTHPPTMGSYLPRFRVHNPLRYYTFIHMHKIYIQIYIFHIAYVGKGD